MAIQWVFDLRETGHPPFPLWDLPADVADEIRIVQSMMNQKESRPRSFETH